MPRLRVLSIALALAAWTHPAQAAALRPSAELLAPRFEKLARAVPIKLPCVTHTVARRPSDPVNLMLLAGHAEVQHLFGAAGWDVADPVDVLSVLRCVHVFAMPGATYQTSPVSDLYLFGRRQDFAFQKNNVFNRSRDHLRLWKVPQQPAEGPVWWAIAATRDVDVKFVGFKPTHRIAPDIDSERALVTHDLVGTGRIAKAYMLSAVPGGMRGVNGDHDYYHSDGAVQVLETDQNPIRHASL